MKKLMFFATGYGLVNLVLFITILVVGRSGIFKGSRLVDLLTISMMLVPLIYYFVSLYFVTKNSIEDGTTTKLVANGFMYAIGIVFGSILPFVVFRIGPDGPINFTSVEEMLMYAFSTVVGSVLGGGLLGLFGMIMINQCFGDKIETTIEQGKGTPNQAL